MILKKYLYAYSLSFNIMNDKLEIEYAEILDDIINTFDDLSIFNRQLEFNKLVKLQQSNNKHALLDFDKITTIDHFKILIKFINNFLIVTKQHENFSLESITWHGENELFAYGSEIFMYSIESITFSPTARTHWKNPGLIDQIIKYNP